MPRWLALLVTTFVASAVAAAPVPKSLIKRVPDVTGTTWVSNEEEVNLGVLEYTFLEGGKLSWVRRGTNTVRTTGSWKQDGEHLYWEVNKRYVDYNVDFQAGQFVGGALNKVNKRWSITLTRKGEK